MPLNQFSSFCVIEPRQDIILNTEKREAPLDVFCVTFYKVASFRSSLLLLEELLLLGTIIIHPKNRRHIFELSDSVSINLMSLGAVFSDRYYILV